MAPLADKADHDDGDEGDSYKPANNPLSCIYVRPYLDKESCINIKNYKYIGGDDGYLHVYFYSPVGDWLVNFLPKNLSANMVSYYFNDSMYYR